MPEVLTALERLVSMDLGGDNRDVHVPPTHDEFDALVDFTFNPGADTLAWSTALPKLNSGDFKDVPALLEKYDRAGGVDMTGQERRREDEAQERIGATA